MALRGNLKDFSLPDVFQLVTFSKKTGVLRIKRADGAEGSVWFRDGDVFFAQSNWHGEPLGERLVHASRITPSALSKALDIRRNEPDGGRRLGEILVDEGYITDKVLEAFVQEQIQDTIFDLMRWDEGDFDFELLPDVVDEDIGLAVSIENVIMEGSRRLEEWTRIKKKIPSMEIVFKMATAPGEGTFEISLKPIEWNLLLLVDGTRSVSQLAQETNRTDFEVARIMYGLFSAGLLEVAGDDEVETLRAERAEREKILGEILAEEAKAKQQAAEEAIEREEALASEAKARLEAAAETGAEAAATAEPEAAAAAAAAVEASVEPAEARPEPEVPEFLAAGAGGNEATAEDMAVFEQMMEAVLETPEEVAAAARTAEHVETEEPELETFESAAIETIGPEVEEEPISTEDFLLAAEELAAEPTTAEEASEEPVPADTGFEADLMALGLGELPGEDLLAPAGVEPGPGPDLLQPEGETGPQPVAEPMSEGFEAPVELEAFLKDVEAEEAAAGIPEPPVIEEPEPIELPEEPLADFADLADLIIEPAEAFADTMPAEEIAQEQSTPDLSDILSSLEEEAADETEVVQTAPLDAEIEGAAAPSAGVISTDAYLADISADGLGVGLSSGLGDELSALTGAAGRSRPTASVRHIPEPGQSVELRRDVTVDKDLVLKIIEGIKNL